MANESEIPASVLLATASEFRKRMIKAEEEVERLKRELSSKDEMSRIAAQSAQARFDEELAAKDAEIKMLESVCRKRVEDLQKTIAEKDKIINRECEWDPGRCGGGCLVWKKCAEMKRENEAKDAEIARLNDELFAYAGGHVITGAERCLREKNTKLEEEIARLNAALKPVMEVDVPSVVRIPSVGEPKIIRDFNYAQNAVREAQRVMREGENHA